MYPKGLAWLTQFIVYGLFQLHVSIDSSPIVGGMIVKKSEISRYSYIVSLQDRNHFENGTMMFKHFCGGSLISSSWILTAGHCVYYKKQREIAAAIGCENLNAEDVVHREVNAIKVNHFVPSSLRNDIALVRLRFPVVLDEGSSIGLLPSPGIKAYRKKPCKIVGYGADKYGGKVQDNLKEGDIFTISRHRCNRILGKVMAPQEGDHMVCGLGELQDSCQGDSGGPLICSVQGKDYIYGIVSHGITCGQPGVPSIYTVTVPYKQWIDGVINTK